MLSRRDRTEIARCEDFVCLITTHWLKSRNASAQLAYAVELGKPVIALLQAGVRLPPALTHVLARAETHTWSTVEDLRAIMGMLEQRHPQGLHLVDGPVYDAGA